MPQQSRGMQRLSRFGLPNKSGKGAGSANDFLSKAAQIRANRQASNRPQADAPLTRGQERRLKLQKFMNMSRGAAKSAAHAGVVSRPMDQQLSRSLDQKRAQARGRGTSLARLKRRQAEEEEEELVDETAADELADAERGTSVARTGRVELPLMRVPKGMIRPPAPKKQEPPDMVI